MDHKPASEVPRHSTSDILSTFPRGILDGFQTEYPAAWNLMQQLGVYADRDPDGKGRLRIRDPKLLPDISSCLGDFFQGRATLEVFMRQLLELIPHDAAAESQSHGARRSEPSTNIYQNHAPMPQTDASTDDTDELEPEQANQTAPSQADAPMPFVPIPFPQPYAEPSDAGRSQPPQPFEPVQAKEPSPDLPVTFDPPGSSALYDPPRVRVTCPSPEVSIHFTLDGTEPTTASDTVRTELQLSRTFTVRARAFRDGKGAGPSRAETYTLCVRPVHIAPPSGTYNPPQSVEMRCETPGSIVRYTLDNSEPTETAEKYDPQERLHLSSGTKVRARAFKPGWKPSEIAEAQYELKMPEWQVLEPKDQTDPVPHEVAEASTLDSEWCITAASVRGKLHAHRGAWREDAFYFGVRDDWTILAVCDGAGSARLSRIGAKLASQQAVQQLQSLLQHHGLQPAEELQPADADLLRLKTFLKEAARTAQTAIQGEAARRGARADEFATTLLLALHTEWQGRDVIASLQIGDGAIALLEGDDQTTLLGQADHGEHSSETRFLTTRGIEDDLDRRVYFSFRTGLRCIAVMTDGVADDFFPEKQRMVELFAGHSITGMKSPNGQPIDGVVSSVLARHDTDKALLEWLRYEKKGSSDDRTLLLYHRSNGK